MAWSSIRKTAALLMAAVAMFGVLGLSSASHAQDKPKADEKKNGKAEAKKADGDGEKKAEGEAAPAPEEPVGPDAIWEATKAEWSKSLRSEDWALRQKAVDAYVKSNHAEAAMALVKTLEDKKAPLNQAQRYYVLGKLGEFSSELAVRAVTRAMAKWTTVDMVYDSYLVLKGFARCEDPAVHAIVSALVKDSSTGIWVKAAALESMGDSRKSHFIDVLMEFITVVGEAWDNDEAILPISAMSAIGRCYAQPKDAKARLPLLSKFRDMLDPEKGGFRNDRVRFWVARTFADVANLPEATEDLWWIDWYLLEIEKGTVGADGKPPESPVKPSATKQKIDFIGMPAIGRRVVFCLDLSLSMNEELDPAVREAAEKRENERGPARTGGDRDKEGKVKKEEKLDWENIKTKLDLAKAYLLRSLDQFAAAEEQRMKDLEEWKKGGKPGKRSGSRGKSILEEPFMFNIVVYATKVQLLDPGTTSFVAATDKEIARFKKLVTDYLEGEGMTNIHGALLEGFRITEGKKVEGDPALNSNALLKGADTVFFMTDGWGSWSDDSTELDWDKRKKNPPPTQKAVGNGKFIYAEDILVDFERLNRFRKVTVNTVGIGNHDRPLMRGLALQSRGQYVDFSGKKPLSSGGGNHPGAE